MNSEKNYVVNYELLGNRIRELRLEKKWSQQTLSEKCDTSTTNISHIERAATIPSLETLVRIANALQVSINTLLCDSLESGVTPVFEDRIHKLLNDCTDREIPIKNSIFRNSLIFQGLPPIKYQNLMYFPLFLPL